jgi:hypothetical protein
MIWFLRDFDSSEKEASRFPDDKEAEQYNGNETENREDDGQESCDNWSGQLNRGSKSTDLGSGLVITHLI